MKAPKKSVIIVTLVSLSGHITISVSTNKGIALSDLYALKILRDPYQLIQADSFSRMDLKQLFSLPNIGARYAIAVLASKRI